MVQLVEHTPPMLMGWVWFLVRSYQRLEKWYLRPVQPHSQHWYASECKEMAHVRCCYWLATTLAFSVKHPRGSQHNQAEMGLNLLWDCEWSRKVQRKWTLMISWRYIPELGKLFTRKLLWTMQFDNMLDHEQMDVAYLCKVNDMEKMNFCCWYNLLF